MKRFLLLSFILIIPAFFLTGCSLTRKKAGLLVTATPKATLFLDGEHLGQTPYSNEKLKPGEYVLKVVPESVGGQALTPWEGRITLTSGIFTLVNRELGLTSELSSGEVLSFEKLADKNAVSMAVVTSPDGAVVTLDGEPKGFAPLSLDNLSEGDHVLLISTPGYQDKTIKAKTVKGNKLIVNVQLARQASDIQDEEDTESDEDQEATPSATPKSSPSPKASASPKASPDTDLEITGSYVQINSPDVGWVRVREEPSTSSEELTKVDHNQKFPLLDTQSGWYQIEYQTGKSGWISGKYAEKFD